MRLAELRQKTTMKRTDERLSVQDLSIDPLVVFDFVKDFGLKYFARLGVDVDVSVTENKSTSQYYKANECVFHLSLKDINVGECRSIVSCEYDGTNALRNMRVFFVSSGNGMAMSPELVDDMESAGNTALKKQFRKRAKKLGK